MLLTLKKSQNIYVQSKGFTFCLIEKQTISLCIPIVSKYQFDKIEITTNCLRYIDGSSPVPVSTVV